MTDLIPVFSGEVQLAGWRETHNSGAVVSFFLSDPSDLEKFRGLTVAKGNTAGHRFVCVLVEIGDDEQPTATASTTATEPPRVADPEHAYGKQASSLYAHGFFLVPDVLKAIGTDQEYLAWLKGRECCIRGSLIADKAHDGDIVPAHVRRIADGAGTGIKPEYSAVPMCDRHHKLQHQSGESEVGGKEWLDRQRNRYVQEWASHELAGAHFGERSIGDITPAGIKTWAEDNHVDMWLPPVYREVAA